MRWLQTTFLTLAVVCCSAHATATYEAHTAWGGYTRNGSVTELVITPSSASTEAMDLRVFGASPPIRVTRAVDPRASRTIAVPLYIKDANQDLRISSGSQFAVADEQTLPLRSVVHDQALVAIVIGESTLFPTTHSRTERVTSVIVGSRDLPRIGLAYQPIDGLAIDETSLSQLLPAQVNALESYLARCGSLAVYRVAPAVLASLREAAGCGGQSIQPVADSDQLQAWIGSLKYTGLRAPLSFETEPHSSAPTKEPAQSQWVLVFFVIFVLVTALFYRRLISVILVSALATALVLFSWGGETYSGSMFSVTENTSGAKHGTLAATMKVAGLYRGQFELGLPEGSAIISTLGDSATELRIEEGRTHVVVSSPTALNSESRISFVLDVPSPNLPALYFEGTQPGVRNTRTTELRNAVMLLSGKAYAVPELRPAQQWTWTESAPNVKYPAWLAHRLTPNEVGLILPNDPDVLRGINAKHGATGWSLVTVSGAV